MSEIPNPMSDGNAGGQQATVSGTSLPMAITALPADPMISTVVDITSGAARGLTGNGSTNLAWMTAYAQSMSHSLQRSESAVSGLRSELDSVKEKLGEEKTRTALLRQRLKDGVSLQKVQLIAVAIGTWLFALAFEFARNEMKLYAITFTLLGLALVLIGWFWPTRAEGT